MVIDTAILDLKNLIKVLRIFPKEDKYETIPDRITYLQLITVYEQEVNNSTSTRKHKTLLFSILYIQKDYTD